QSVPGGYIIAGTTESDGVEVYLARTDEAGNYIWTHNYGREYHEWGSFTYLEEDGSYFTVGQSAGPDVTADFYLSKKGSKGEPLWSRTYGGEAYDWAYSMEKAGAGFVLAGLTYSFGAGNDDIYIVKTDAEGGLEWQKQYGGSGYDEAFSISAAGEGFILAGSTSSWGALNHDGLLMLVDSSG
ncbi:MAG TPA: hypothetical protein P5511_09595, partial [Candidatus Goldiibacteriota bacterium]|nr:hypothetical protein [Candidatus Goldiibacteriota bacterium]